jgi:hypothetical protein
MDIQWQRGNYHKFLARMKIRIGQNSQGIMQIEQGDEIEYDGTILKYAGAEITSPSLRGAIKTGWLVSVGNDISDLPQSVQPHRKIAKAQTINTDLSKVQRSDSGVLETADIDEQTILSISDRQDKGKPGVTERPEPRKLTASVKKGVQDQDGEVVGRIRSPAKAESVDVSRDTDYGKKLNELEMPKPIGKKPNQNVILKEGVEIKTNVGSVSPTINEEENEGTVIGKVRKSEKISSEGISVEDTSSRQSKPGLHLNSNGLKIDMKIPTRIRIARHIKPDFPIDWSFDGKLSERMNTLKSYGTDPQTLEAVYAAEGDNFRRALEKEFPKQFR